MTLDYTLSRTASLGLEYNPVTKEVQPRGTWFLAPEKGGLPSVVLGASADRLSTDRGHAAFLTFAKALDNGRWMPFVSLKYTSDSRMLGFPFGMNARIAPGLTLQTIYDTNYTHVILTHATEDMTVGLVLARTRYWGVQVGYRF